jgi:hypothetical protein
MPTFQNQSSPPAPARRKSPTTWWALPPDQPLLVPSADGATKRMLFTIPLWAVTTDRLGADNPYGSAYRDLLLKLPTGVEPLVLTHRSGATEVERWLAEAGLASRNTVVEAEDYLRFSIWAEDGYVALHDPDRDVSGLVEPALFPRNGDALVADYVRAEGNLGTFQAVRD